MTYFHLWCSVDLRSRNVLLRAFYGPWTRYQFITSLPVSVKRLRMGRRNHKVMASEQFFSASNYEYTLSDIFYSE